MEQATASNDALFIGQAISDGGRTGYIADIKDTVGQTFLMLGGPSPMTEIKQSITIVYPRADDTPTLAKDVDEFTVARYASGTDREPLTVEAVAELVNLAENAADVRVNEARQKRIDDDIARAQYVESIRARVPAWATSVITAERHIDDCDSQSDYFGYKTAEILILAFSKHGRDLFPELRKAAGNAPETMEYSIKPEMPEGKDAEYWTPEDEHREKYSMGGGYYLGVWRNRSGWVIQKQSISGAEGVPTGRWCVPEGKAKAKRVPRVTDSGAAAGSIEDTTTGSASIEEHTHTKKGFQMFIVVLTDRVDRPRFTELRAAAGEMGGWYSRQWGTTPGGFAFESRAEAQAFINAHLAAPAPDGGGGGTKKAAPLASLGERFKGLADTMQTAIDGALAERQTNTPKRLAQAMHSRVNGEKLLRTRAALLALAELHDAGTVPEILAGIKSKKHVFDHMGAKLEQVANGYHAYHIDTGRPHNSDAVTLALWALLKPKSEDEIKADELQRAVEGLQFAQIPGFFPTPGAVVDIMIDLADLEPGHMVLEPSLGSCAIADKIAPLVASVRGFEINHTLAEIAQAKGYLLKRADFLKCEGTNLHQCWNYDRVLMNPPFEKLQDIDHVMHAFHFLADGGRLVSVMSPGPFFRTDAKCQQFRAWIELTGAEVVELPAGSFKESGTGVGAVLVVIDK